MRGKGRLLDLAEEVRVEDLAADDPSLVVGRADVDFLVSVDVFLAHGQAPGFVESLPAIVGTVAVGVPSFFPQKASVVDEEAVESAISIVI